METNGQLHSPPLYFQEITPILMNRRLCGPQRRSGRFWKREKWPNNFSRRALRTLLCAGKEIFCNLVNRYQPSGKTLSLLPWKSQAAHSFNILVPKCQNKCRQIPKTVILSFMTTCLQTYTRNIRANKSTHSVAEHFKYICFLGLMASVTDGSWHAL